MKTLLITLVLHAHAGRVKVECEMSRCNVSLAAPFNLEIQLQMEKCTEDESNAFLAASKPVTMCGETDLPEVTTLGAGMSQLGLVVEDSKRFRIHARDPTLNNFIAEGELDTWEAWQAPSRALVKDVYPDASAEVSRRRLIYVRNVLREMLKIDSLRSGTRSDCEKEGCPKRWANCWGGSANEVKQINVAVFLEQTFCDNFGDNDKEEISVCIQLVEGIFLDANMVFEAQLGMHLVMAYVIPPTVIARHFPQLTVGGSIEDGNYLGSIKNSWSGKNGCGTADAFKSVTGYEFDDFGIAHAFVSLKPRGSTFKESSLIGKANVGQLCTCSSMSWSRHDFTERSWMTFAHEIGHVFGANHPWGDGKVDPAQSNKGGLGIMGYGSGKVNGIFMFHPDHRTQMCDTIKTRLSGNKKCFHPYLLPPKIDYSIKLVPLIIIIASLTICCFLFCVRWIIIIYRRGSAIMDNVFFRFDPSSYSSSRRPAVI